jgi:ABC-type dipeptide/oligopeptide/nickel transport system permease subunit
LVILAIVVLSATFAPLIVPYDPAEQNYLALTVPPSREYILGTDNLGRDVLSRIIYGTRVSLQVGIIAVGISVLLGVPLGLLSGYLGGWVDDVIMRLSDSIQAFPSLILALGITAALGKGMGNAMIAIGFVSVPGFARLTRGQTLSLRERDFVSAARVLGISPLKIMGKHILPNGAGPIIVQAALRVAGAITTEASLSFLGVGAQPPTPSWGSMLRTGSMYLEVAPWIAISSGAAIFLTVLAFNFVGDGLREALDPQLVRRRRA